MKEQSRLNGYHLYRPAAWIHVTGEDAYRFLQSQFSNDLQDRAMNEAVYGLWLDHKGKVHGDSFVIRVEEEDFRLMSYATPSATIAAKLETFIIADDVELGLETDQVAAISFLLNGETEWVEGVGLRSDFRGKMDWMGGELFVFPGRRHSGKGFEVVGKRSVIEGLLEKLERDGFGLYKLSEEDLEVCRILNRIPAIPKDIGTGELPQEGKLEGRAISFSKGCFLGQEVMSRLHSMGRVRRYLVRLKADRELPYGATVRVGQKKVGQVKSGILVEDGYIALALISLAVEADTGLWVETGNETISLRRF